MSAHSLGSTAFPAGVESVAAARRWCADQLKLMCPSSEDVVLLLSEVFTNAVVHSTGDKVEVSLFAVGCCVRVEVVDGGSETLPHDASDPWGQSGQGLPIIQALADDWGYEPLERGLKVWFVVQVLSA
ncbi:ATP-binding protein [Actinomadura adrarensis]|uniref:ATP-binding protein n=1 Tax=Actinomadura adrarensis TaxID=1819600 RepID=A0ABW3CAM8_9ACTN